MHTGRVDSRLSPRYDLRTHALAGTLQQPCSDGSFIRQLQYIALCVLLPNPGLGAAPCQGLVPQCCDREGSAGSG